MILDASTVVPGILIAAYGVFWTLVRAAAFVAREEERLPLHRHTCSRCGRIQHWTEQFDQWSPCPACQRLQPGMVASDTKPKDETATRPKRPYDDQKQGGFLPGRKMVEIDLDMTPDEIARVIERESSMARSL